MPDQLTTMCFCKVEKPNRDEELVIPNRPRQQASHRLSCSSKSTGGRNIAVIPSGLQPRGAVQSFLRPRIVELRRSVSQDRIVLVETITPRQSGPEVRQRPYFLGEGPLPRELRRETQPLSIAKSKHQLGTFLVHAQTLRGPDGLPTVITPEQSGIVVHPLIRSRRLSDVSHRST